mgnify:FL=1
MVRTWQLDRRTPGSQSFSLKAWQRYIHAIASYHRHDLRIQSLADYERAIDRLGGALFQILPDLRPDLAGGAHAFGALDQCYNHLRDLQEDTQSGLCYFPADILASFGLHPADFATSNIFKKSGYRKFMEFWLRDYIPAKRFQAEQFASRPDLPQTWRSLCDWSLDRYRRIETCLARCDYSYIDFSSAYWPSVCQYLLQERHRYHRVESV